MSGYERMRERGGLWLAGADSSRFQTNRIRVESDPWSSIH